MEMRIFFLTLFIFLKNSYALVLTDQEIIGMMNTEVTIPCKIMYSDTDPWYVVQWKKRQGNADKTLVTLATNIVLNPIWSQDGDLNEFKSRARTSFFMDETSVTFNLTIYDFTCRDVGMYSCDVTSNTKKVGSTNVTIKAKPMPPKIHSTYLILEVNNTYTLECDAAVGIPPTEINWYYRPPGDLKFIRVQSEPELEILPGSSDCVPRAIQRLKVTGSEKSSGTTFRCFVNSSSCGGVNENENCYADVVVEVPAQIKPEPTYQVACEGDACKKGYQNQNLNGSLQQKGRLLVILTGLLYTTLVSGLR